LDDNQSVGHNGALFIIKEYAGPKVDVPYLGPCWAILMAGTGRGQVRLVRSLVPGEQFDDEISVCRSYLSVRLYRPDSRIRSERLLVSSDVRLPLYVGALYLNVKLTFIFLRVC